MESPSGLRTTSLSVSRRVCCTASKGSDALTPPLSTITALRDSSDTGTEISTVLPPPVNGPHRHFGFELARRLREPRPSRCRVRPLRSRPAGADAAAAQQQTKDVFRVERSHRLCRTPVRGLPPHGAAPPRQTHGRHPGRQRRLDYRYGEPATRPYPARASRPQRVLQGTRRREPPHCARSAITRPAPLPAHVHPIGALHRRLQSPPACPGSAQYCGRCAARAQRRRWRNQAQLARRVPHLCHFALHLFHPGDEVAAQWPQHRLQVFGNGAALAQRCCRTFASAAGNGCRQMTQQQRSQIGGLLDGSQLAL